MTRMGVSGVIVTAMTVLCLTSLPILIDTRECLSIDVRNNLASLSQLDGCTVVKGHLMIVLLTKNISINDYSNITFPNLREITDYFILYDVKGLTSFKKLLPNLTVIRGRKLFLNYAMAVSNMPDLEAFEFNSLVAIQRGHVYIGSCPKLCFLKKVNWDRLTLSPGENHVFPMTEATCAPSDCTGCESEYCWSDMVCQKFENDNVVNLALGSLHCHTECLGGCFNRTNAGCVVCKGITNHGVCVTECPNNLYYSEHHQRCYTKQECGIVRGYVHGNECNRGCPFGYVSSRKLSECIKCATGCNNACVPPDGYTGFVVFSLADAENLKGCHSLNGSLYIEFRNKIDEKDLRIAFENVREVQGHIQVVSSPFLKSLSFLENVENVHGLPLENKTFALIIYKNKNLEELWTSPTGKNTELVHGGIYTYSNYKLCNRVVQDFARRVIHDRDKDLLQLNDQEVLCDPAKLHIEVMLITQNNATVSWARNQTAIDVEILYREAKYNKGEASELDDHVCERINWKRNLLFSADIPHSATHFTYQISGLRPFTDYEVLVKTFQAKGTYSARSPILLFTTAPDFPTAPTLKTLKKDFKSITLSWSLRNNLVEKVNYFLLQTFEQPVDLEMLDTRNFCNRPTLIFGVSPLEDYDDCCRRIKRQQQDDEFRQDMKNMFPCTVQTEQNCHNMEYSNISRVEPNAGKHQVNDLKPSTLYTFFLYACNQIGCGTSYMYSEKTEFSAAADDVDKVDVCRVSGTNEYHLMFQEPKHPNGAIVSYTIHFQKKQDTDSLGLYRGELNCVTRKQHEMAGYRYVTVLNLTFEQAAVRSTSLAGSILSKWFEIEVCKNVDPKRGIGAIGVFIICFTFCALVAVVWMSIRRQWWRRINTWRREAINAVGVVRFDDQQVLVSTFDTVTFENTLDD